MILFGAFTFLTLLRYYLSPRIFIAMLHHETHSLFLGTIPMGLVTIVSGIAATGEEYGLKTLDAALVLYWITVGESKVASTVSRLAQKMTDMNASLVRPPGPQASPA